MEKKPNTGVMEDNLDPTSVIHISRVQEDDLDDTLAYENLVHILSQETRNDSEKAELIELLHQLLGERNEISDHIAILSGLAQLKIEDRLHFCQKMLNFPLHNKIPGWLIYQTTQCTTEERLEFLHNLDLWFRKNKKMFPFPKVGVSKEKTIFQSIQTILQPSPEDL